MLLNTSSLEQTTVYSEDQIGDAQEAEPSDVRHGILPHMDNLESHEVLYTDTDTARRALASILWIRHCQTYANTASVGFGKLGSTDCRWTNEDQFQQRINDIKNKVSSYGNNVVYGCTPLKRTMTTCVFHAVHGYTNIPEYAHPYDPEDKDKYLIRLFSNTDTYKTYRKHHKSYRIKYLLCVVSETECRLYTLEKSSSYKLSYTETKFIKFKHDNKTRKRFVSSFKSAIKSIDMKTSVRCHLFDDIVYAQCEVNREGQMTISDLSATHDLKEKKPIHVFPRLVEYMNIGEKRMMNAARESQNWTTKRGYEESKAELEAQFPVDFQFVYITEDSKARGSEILDDKAVAKMLRSKSALAHHIRYLRFMQLDLPNVIELTKPANPNIVMVGHGQFMRKIVLPDRVEQRTTHPPVVPLTRYASTTESVGTGSDLTEAPSKASPVLAVTTPRETESEIHKAEPARSVFTRDVVESHSACTDLVKYYNEVGKTSQRTFFAARILWESCAAYQYFHNRSGFEAQESLVGVPELLMCLAACTSGRIQQAKCKRFCDLGQDDTRRACEHFVLTNLKTDLKSIQKDLDLESSQKDLKFSDQYSYRVALAQVMRVHIGHLQTLDTSRLRVLIKDLYTTFVEFGGDNKSARAVLEHTFGSCSLFEPSLEAKISALEVDSVVRLIEQVDGLMPPEPPPEASVQKCFVKMMQQFSVCNITRTMTDLMFAKHGGTDKIIHFQSDYSYVSEALKLKSPADMKPAQRFLYDRVAKMPSSMDAYNYLRKGALAMIRAGKKYGASLVWLVASCVAAYFGGPYVAGLTGLTLMSDLVRLAVLGGSLALSPQLMGMLRHIVHEVKNVANIYRKTGSEVYMHVYLRYIMDSQIEVRDHRQLGKNLVDYVYRHTLYKCDRRKRHNYAITGKRDLRFRSYNDETLYFAREPAGEHGYTYHIFTSPNTEPQDVLVHYRNQGIEAFATDEVSKSKYLRELHTLYATVESGVTYFYITFDTFTDQDTEPCDYKYYMFRHSNLKKELGGGGGVIQEYTFKDPRPHDPHSDEAKMHCEKDVEKVDGITRFKLVHPNHNDKCIYARRREIDPVIKEVGHGVVSLPRLPTSKNTKTWIRNLENSPLYKKFYRKLERMLKADTHVLRARHSTVRKVVERLAKKDTSAGVWQSALKKGGALVDRENDRYKLEEWYNKLPPPHKTEFYEALCRALYKAKVDSVGSWRSSTNKKHEKKVRSHVLEKLRVYTGEAKEKAKKFFFENIVDLTETDCTFTLEHIQSQKRIHEQPMWNEDCAYVHKHACSGSETGSSDDEADCGAKRRPRGVCNFAEWSSRSFPYRFAVPKNQADQKLLRANLSLERHIFEKLQKVQGQDFTLFKWHSTGRWSMKTLRDIAKASPVNDPFLDGMLQYIVQDADQTWKSYIMNLDEHLNINANDIRKLIHGTMAAIGTAIDSVPILLKTAQLGTEIALKAVSLVVQVLIKVGRFLLKKGGKIIRVLQTDERLEEWDWNTKKFNQKIEGMEQGITNFLKKGASEAKSFASSAANAARKMVSMDKALDFVRRRFLAFKDQPGKVPFAKSLIRFTLLVLMKVYDVVRTIPLLRQIIIIPLEILIPNQFVPSPRVCARRVISKLMCAKHVLSKIYTDKDDVKKIIKHFDYKIRLYLDRFAGKQQSQIDELQIKRLHPLGEDYKRAYKELQKEWHTNALGDEGKTHTTPVSLAGGGGGGVAPASPLPEGGPSCIMLGLQQITVERLARMIADSAGVDARVPDQRRYEQLRDAVTRFYREHDREELAGNDRTVKDTLKSLVVSIKNAYTTATLDEDVTREVQQYLEKPRAPPTAIKDNQYEQYGAYTGILRIFKTLRDMRVYEKRNLERYTKNIDRGGVTIRKVYREDLSTDVYELCPGGCPLAAGEPRIQFRRDELVKVCAALAQIGDVLRLFVMKENKGGNSRNINSVMSSCGLRGIDPLLARAIVHSGIDVVSDTDVSKLSDEAKKFRWGDNNRALEDYLDAIMLNFDVIEEDKESQTRTRHGETEYWLPNPASTKGVYARYSVIRRVAEITDNLKGFPWRAFKNYQDAASKVLGASAAGAGATAGVTGIAAAAGAAVGVASATGFGAAAVAGVGVVGTVASRQIMNQREKELQEWINTLIKQDKVYTDFYNIISMGWNKTSYGFQKMVARTFRVDTTFVIEKQIKLWALQCMVMEGVADKEHLDIEAEMLVSTPEDLVNDLFRSMREGKLYTIANTKQNRSHRIREIVTGTAHRTREKTNKVEYCIDGNSVWATVHELREIAKDLNLPFENIKGNPFTIARRLYSWWKGFDKRFLEQTKKHIIDRVKHVIEKSEKGTDSNGKRFTQYELVWGKQRFVTRYSTLLEFAEEHKHKFTNSFPRKHGYRRLKELNKWWKGKDIAQTWWERGNIA